MILACVLSTGKSDDTSWYFTGKRHRVLSLIIVTEIKTTKKLINLTALWADSADDKLMIFFSFSHKIDYDISRRLSPSLGENLLEMAVCFLGNNKKKYFKMPLSMQRVIKCPVSLCILGIWCNCLFYRIFKLYTNSVDTDRRCGIWPCIYSVCLGPFWDSRLQLG